MQGIQQPGLPFAGAGAPVQCVPAPPGPQGVIPNFTQAGVPPFATWQPGTYPGAGVPTGAMPTPSIFPTPGPSTFGAPLPAGTLGGVPGVSLAPVGHVIPPAPTGGPHGLPTLPQLPLPQGFPNPFALQQVGTAAPQPPGLTMTTGPAGYLPGLGQFGMPGQAAASALGTLGLQGFGQAAPYLPPAMQAQPFPGLLSQPFPGVQAQPFPAFPAQLAPTFQVPPAPAFQVPPQPLMQPPAPAAPAQAPIQTQAQAAAFWQHLAWQLIQSPSVRTALGARFSDIVEGTGRLGAFQVATACLQGGELQAAFRALSAGTMDQRSFLDRFTATFRTALQNAGLLAPE